MGKVSSYLTNLIKSQVKEKGIVVWYDPEHNYETYLTNLNFSGIPLFKYEGTYFKIRKDIDEYLSKETPDKCIIYIPKERNRASSPLIEAESAGQVMEPSGATQTNTRLEVVALEALRKVLPSQRVDEICKSVVKGSLTLEDLDKIAEKGGEVGADTVMLIFGTTAAEEVGLKFLSSDKYDAKIKEKHGLNELHTLLSIGYGFTSTKKDIEQVRNEFARYVLLSDFLSHIKNKTIHKTFADSPYAKKEVYNDACKQLALTWRNRVDLRDSYDKLSNKVENILSIGALSFNPDEIISCDTFQTLERFLYNHACHLILSDNLPSALSILEQRKVSFWAINDPVGLLRWSLLDTVIKLITIALQIKRDLTKQELAYPDIVDNYVNDSENTKGWYSLDYYHRMLENQYATYDEGVSDEGDETVLQVISKARDLYMDVAGLMATVFVESLAAENYNFAKMPRQTTIFKDYVGKQIAHSKTAYLLVDAMRYEMGKDLFDSIDDFKKKNISYAVAVIPTVTEMGMAALLPGGDAGVTILKSGSGELTPQIQDVSVKDRKARIEWIKKSTDKKAIDLKLEQIIKPRKKIKEQIQESDFIIVTSQEIDAICEGDNITLARKVMNDILSELARGIRNLYQMGVKQFIVTSDHGYLFGDELTEAMKVDAPGGETITIHRRFWAGYGGTQSDAFVRVSSEQLGVGGDFEFAFPKGIAGFKAKGGARAYFHGGLSLEELIIPIITINAQEIERPTRGKKVHKISVDRTKITSRFFTVKLLYSFSGLFAENTSRVLISVKAGKTIVGKVATAVYGHEVGTSEVLLEKDKENHITLILNEGISEKQITVSIFDSETGKELASSELLEIALTF